MTEEDKKLLLTDLCARLPNGIKCHEDDVEYSFDIIGTTTNNKEFVFSDGYERSLEQIKPYLRLISSMTEEERKEFINLCSTHYTISSGMDQTYLTINVGNGFHKQDAKPYNKIEDIKIIDWLNEHHFDYRGLIEKGLALEAPEDMYKTE